MKTKQINYGWKRILKESFLTSFIIILYLFPASFTLVKFLNGQSKFENIVGIIIILVIPIALLIAKSIHTYIKTSKHRFKYSIIIFFSCLMMTIILMFLVGLIIQFVKKSWENFQETQSEKTNNPMICKLTGDHKNECLLRLAETNDDINLCLSAMEDQSENCHDGDLTCDLKNAHDCIIKIVLKEKNAQLCSEYFTEEIEGYETGRESCYYQLAKDTLDTQICENLEKMHDKCVGYIAGKEQDYTLCSQMKNSDNKIVCLKSIAKEAQEIEVCNLLNEKEDYEECILGYAMKNNDMQLCDRLEIPNIVLECKNIFYQKTLKRAIEEINQSLCTEIDSALLKEHCIVETSKKMLESAKSNGDSALCYEIYDTDTKIECFETLAIQNKDISLCQAACEEMDSVQLCNLCKLNVIKKVANPKLCDEHFEETNKDWCLLSLALNSSNIDLCEKAGEFRDECIFRMIILNSNNSQSYCNNIEKINDSSLQLRLKKLNVC